MQLGDEREIGRDVSHLSKPLFPPGSPICGEINYNSVLHLEVGYPTWERNTGLFSNINK